MRTIEAVGTRQEASVIIFQIEQVCDRCIDIACIPFSEEREPISNQRRSTGFLTFPKELIEMSNITSPSWIKEMIKSEDCTENNFPITNCPLKDIPICDFCRSGSNRWCEDSLSTRDHHIRHEHDKEATIPGYINQCRARQQILGLI